MLLAGGFVGDDDHGPFVACAAHAFADLRAELEAKHRGRAALLRTAIGLLTDLEVPSMRASVFLDLAVVRAEVRR